MGHETKLLGFWFNPEWLRMVVPFHDIENYKIRTSLGKDDECRFGFHFRYSKNCPGRICTLMIQKRSSWEFLFSLWQKRWGHLWSLREKVEVLNKYEKDGKIMENGKALIWIMVEFLDTVNGPFEIGVYEYFGTALLRSNSLIKFTLLNCTVHGF